jgi:hypothetical protein
VGLSLHDEWMQIAAVLVDLQMPQREVESWPTGVEQKEEVEVFSLTDITIKQTFS